MLRIDMLPLVFLHLCSLHVFVENLIQIFKNQETLLPTVLTVVGSFWPIYNSSAQKFEFIFAKFTQDICHKTLIFVVFESIHCHPAKYFHIISCSPALEETDTAFRSSRSKASQVTLPQTASCDSP